MENRTKTRQHPAIRNTKYLEFRIQWGGTGKGEVSGAVLVNGSLHTHFHAETTMVLGASLWSAAASGSQGKSWEVSGR